MEMDQDLSEAMGQKSDSELLEIVSKLKEDYPSETVSAAKAEIKKRNVSVDQVELLKEAIEIKEKGQSEKENEALEIKHKILFFLFFWGVNSWSMAGAFKAKGYKKKYKDARKFMKMGMVVFIGFPLLVLIVLSLVR
jgi:hypothetical protein